MNGKVLQKFAQGAHRIIERAPISEQANCI